MFNQAPIFLFCLSRGGSNIFWNIFLTHPDACSPIQETIEIFSTNLRSPSWEGYYVSLFSGQPKLFDQWQLRPRKPVRQSIQDFIDRTFYKRKLRTNDDLDMKFKYEDKIYKPQEVLKSRLVTKNNTGLVFLSDLYNHMYPDSTFFALVRDPVALYESHKRRNINKTVDRFADFYNRITGRMIQDKDRFDRFYVVRFEDILADPLKMTQNLYQLAGLEFGKVTKMRFRAKPHYQPDGSHQLNYPTTGHYWFDFEDVYQILDPNINKYQTDKLDKSEREMVLMLTRERRETFNYT